MGILHLKDGVVSGIMLGDGHLNVRRSSLEFQHTLPQLNYLKFKLGLLEQLGFNCRLFSLTKKRTNLGIYDYCSGSANGGQIEQYYHYSLDDKLNTLNSLGLMIWWLDDGMLSVHKKDNGSVSRFGYLNTQGFSLEENKRICLALSERFGLESTIHIDSKSGFAKRDHWRIYLNATNVRRLIDHVRVFIPWTPNNMRYKFNMQYVVNRRSDSLEMATHYNF